LQRPKTLLALPDLSYDVNTVSKNIVHNMSYDTALITTVAAIDLYLPIRSTITRPHGVQSTR
jgi:hypothetical protein